LAAPLAVGLRRAMLLTAAAAEPGQEAGVGLVLLVPDGSIESANSAAETWLDALAVRQHA
jgi:hypothetical protein